MKFFRILATVADKLDLTANFHTAGLTDSSK